MKQSSGGPGIHLAGADGLRAVACLGVIFHHLAQLLNMNLQPPAIQDIQSFLLMGNAGVSVFFVLSGYLLALPFWRGYLEQGDFPQMKHYILRRAARIVPGYYTVLILCIALVLILGIPSESFWLRSLAGLTFTSGFHYVTFFPSEINGPLWSISFEVFSYLLLPLCMLGLFRLFGKRRSFKGAMGYWVGVLLVLLAVNQVIHVLLTPGPDMRSWDFGLIGGAKYWMPNYNPVGFFGHFAIGIIASGVVCRLQSTERTASLRKRGGFDVLGGLFLLGAVVLIWAARHQPEFSWSIQHQPYLFPWFALLVAGFLATAPYSRWLPAIVDNGFFRYTAKISFGLYIWHNLIMTLANKYWIADMHYFGIWEVGRWVWIVLGVLAASYIAATLSYYLIEKPVLDRAHLAGKRLPKPASEGAKNTNA